MTSLLGIRAVLFSSLFSWAFMVYVPGRLLLASGRDQLPSSNLASALPVVLTLAGLLVVVRCIWEFFSRGRGTPAPFDPPRCLVVSGLYRFTRNPMYNGFLLVLASEAWLFRSLLLLAYTAVTFAAVHLLVVLYEEPVLRATFGEAYQQYRAVVPRWGLTFRPFTDTTTSSV